MENFKVIYLLVKAGFYLSSGQGETGKPNKIALGFEHKLKNISPVFIELDREEKEYKNIKELLNL